MGGHRHPSPRGCVEIRKSHRSRASTSSRSTTTQSGLAIDVSRDRSRIAISTSSHDERRGTRCSLSSWHVHSGCHERQRRAAGHDRADHRHPVRPIGPVGERLIRVASVLGNQFHEVILGALLTLSIGYRCRRSPGSRSGFWRNRTTARFAMRSTMRCLATQRIRATVPPAKQLHRLAARSSKSGPRHCGGGVVVGAALLRRTCARTGLAYSLTAAEIAETQNATAEAAAALERAIGVRSLLPSVDASARSTVAEQLGDLYYVLGTGHQADRCTTSRGVEPDPLIDVSLMRDSGRRKRGGARASDPLAARADRQVPATTTNPSWLAALGSVALAEAAVRARQAVAKPASRSPA